MISAEAVFMFTIGVYALLIVAVSYFYSKSGHQVAHENSPKIIKHITQAFVTLAIFFLLFYLAINNLISKDVLITLVSVFATAGFLTFKEK